MIKDPAQEEKKKVRQFGWVGFVFFLAIALLSWWRDHETARNIFGGLSAFFVFFTLVSPVFMRIVYRGWMAVIGVIAWINRTILLSFVFFCIITPYAIVMRITKRDFMQNRLDLSAQSYWIPREGSPPDKASYEKRH